MSNPTSSLRVMRSPLLRQIRAKSTKSSMAPGSHIGHATAKPIPPPQPYSPQTPRPVTHSKNPSTAQPKTAGQGARGVGKVPLSDLSPDVLSRHTSASKNKIQGVTGGRTEAADSKILGMNKEIVNNITQPHGARREAGRQGQRKEGELPPGYASTARKVTLAIVALPIALVTSWVLWERLVLGRERKELVNGGEGEKLISVRK